MNSRSHTKKRIKLNVCTHEIYDGAMAADSWPIGIRASYPPELLKNILAASIACKLGNQSVDYTRKRYLNNWTPESVGLNPNAYDLKTLHSLSNLINSMEDVVIGNSHRLSYSSIQAIADFTLAKAANTLHIALNLSSKGLLHEVLSIGRNALEMMFWAHRIFNLSDKEDPFKYYPEKSITAFKPIYAGIGKYYGYLSEYSHWRPHTHVPLSNMRNKDENLQVVYASGKNKWESIANIIFMLMLYTRLYCTVYAKLDCLDGETSLVPEMTIIHQKLSSMWKEWKKFFVTIDDPYLSKVFFEIVQSNEMKDFLG